MKIYVAAALTALAVLGGCNSSNQTANAPNANGNGNGNGNGAESSEQQVEATIPDHINGTIKLRVPAAINPGAKLSVQLVDVAQPEISLAETSEVVSGQPPYHFTLSVDPSDIDPTRVYVVNVLLLDGERHYVPALQSPVLTGGAGSEVEVVLNSEATPGEELKAAFNKLKSHIGGMKRIQNSFLDGDLSVAWDGFVEAGNKLRFMRVNSELGEGDSAVRTNIEYAFLDGKPMAILKKGRITTRVGWDENGTLILNEVSGGESVSEEQAQSYYDDALKAYAMGEKKLPKRK
ncbi:MAG TPA: YbaY family lipoprotein [Dokdonella sp.]|uniref:YbaY family lipoprotein n=1 Tax=Dokdonella sp. TaxID=2291710 RepID=UPI002D7EDFB5|nr:YbaY family lipoprotein [Dokdonella sp.]HET9033035.1 YbaY family lipoprotein [Dokdonella sp.]